MKARISAFAAPVPPGWPQDPDDVQAVFDAVRGLFASGAPLPPDWVMQIPLIGPELHAWWTSIANDAGRLLDLISPYLSALSDVVLASDHTARIAKRRFWFRGRIFSHLRRRQVAAGRLRSAHRVHG